MERGRYAGEDLIYDQIPIPQQPAVFTNREAQRRPGSRHSLGGRKRQLTDEIRRQYRSRSASLICAHLDGLGDRDACFAGQFVSGLVALSETTLSLEHLRSLSETQRIELRSAIQRFVHLHTKNKRDGLEMVYGPAIAVSARFPSTTRPSAAQGTSSKARERHTSCTWIDSYGNIRCTCIGSTNFRILATTGKFNDACCDHALAIFLLLDDFASATGANRQICGRVLGCINGSKFSAENDAYISQLPLFTYVHKEDIVILAKKDVSDGRCAQLVPLRCLKQSGRHLICAFCDLTRTNQCEHVSEVHSLMMQGGPAVLPQKRESRKSRKNLSGANWNPMDELNSISHFPLAIVDCKDALRVDRLIVQLSQGNSPFYVSAPKICSSCTSSRNEGTRKVQKGIVLCSEGPCRMHVELYDCSKPDCKYLIHSEGRDHKVLLLTLSTAATHVMLRRILTGVVLSNGTLNGRLMQYHSEMLANVDADLIPGTTVGNVPYLTTLQHTEVQVQMNIQLGLFCSAPAKEDETNKDEVILPDSDTGVLGQERKWRSTRVMQDLCVAMCKLMIMNPPSDLFRCANCEDECGRLHAICIDGIWAGYQKALGRMFENISQPCQALSQSTAASARAVKRPLTSLIRKPQTVAHFCSME